MRLLEGSSTLYTSLSVKVGRIGAKLVCLSITSKQAKVAPECCHAVQGWKWRCPLTGAQSRSYSHGVPKVSTFTHHNKLTSRIVSKPLMGLTILNQALICTPTPNPMGVIQSESMISQAFQACYSIEGCLSDYCILSQERVGYKIGNIYQLNLSPRSSLSYSRELYLQPQELLR